MPPAREFRRRIKSVKSTMQVTKAMELVSAAKLRRSQQKVLNARPYSNGMKGILERVSLTARESSHPFFEVREGGKTCLVVVTSDKGLCGAYNTNVLKKAEESLTERKPEDTVLFLVGRNGFDYFRKRKWTIAGKHTEMRGRLDLRMVQTVTDELLQLYLSGEVNEIRLLYTSFISLLSRKVTLETFLPIKMTGPGPGKSEGSMEILDYILEPSPEAIFESLLPRYAMTRIFIALAESFASENSARMVAMSAATKNAEEMIDYLTLIMNRLRQAAITKEISEIVAGGENLR